MAKRTLARSELEIARVVWELGEATVRQVADALPEERGIDFWTVQTYLRRLKDKGYLKTRKQGRSNVYLPAVEPDAVVSEVTDDFINQLFDGEAMPLFQHLIDARGLSDSEIDQLQASLDDLKTRRQNTKQSAAKAEKTKGRKK